MSTPPCRHRTAIEQAFELGNELGPELLQHVEACQTRSDRLQELAAASNDLFAVR